MIYALRGRDVYGRTSNYQALAAERERLREAEARIAELRLAAERENRHLSQREKNFIHQAEIAEHGF